jgi:hypothetical protein
MQDLVGSIDIHFCEHEPHGQEEYYDKSWMVYADDYPIVIYWQDERSWSLPSPGHYTYTIFHKDDRAMDGPTGAGIEKEGGGGAWGPEYVTWVDKISPVRELADKYFGHEKRDFADTVIHEIFLGRRLAIAQIGVLPSDMLRRLSDMDHVCNLVGDSLRKRGYDRYFRVERACESLFFFFIPRGQRNVPGELASPSSSSSSHEDKEMCPGELASPSSSSSSHEDKEMCPGELASPSSSSSSPDDDD